MIQDPLDNIRENYRRLRVAIGCEHRDRCWVHQVHGADVCSILPGDCFESGTKADALVTIDAGRLLSVKYADCVPILLATANGSAVAAVHAGWRGIVAGVLPAAVNQLRLLSHAPVDSLRAAVGPCIGFDAFEVSEDVLATFVGLFGPADAPIHAGAAGKGFVDLEQSVRLQLLAAGLPMANIDLAGLCTYHDRAQFFSHRRDGGLTGRMAAVVGPQGAR